MAHSRTYGYTGRQSSHYKPQTKSQRKREAYNYRAAYFDRNPGLFGCIWFCSQCGMPMFGRDNVQVDHIIPLAGMGINRTINTVAICPKCNREKSDKVGKYAVKGVFAKICEVVLFTAQKIILLTIVAILKILHTILKAVWDLLKMVFSLLGFQARVVVIGVLIIIILLMII